MNRLVFRFCTQQILESLKQKEFYRPLNIDIAREFVEHRNKYTPYVETISGINKLMVEEAASDKDHMSALWQWRYNLLDAIPFCEPILGKDQLEDPELDMLSMMAVSHPYNDKLVQKLIKVLKSKSESQTAELKHLYKVAQLCCVLPDKQNNRLFGTMQKDLANRSGDVSTLSQILMCSYTKNGQSSESYQQENELKTKILAKMAKLIPKELSTLTPKDRGQMIGNLIQSSSRKDVQVFITQLGKSVSIKTTEEFLAFLEFSQQFAFLLSRVMKKPSKNIFFKLLSILELQKTKFKSDQKVASALEDNRYLMQVIMLDVQLQLRYAEGAKMQKRTD